MKLNQLIKSVIVSTLLFSSYAAQAEQMSEVIPYYGDDFYKDIKMGVSNEALQFRLKDVLRSYHVARPGQVDLIARTCQAGQGKCYTQKPLDYTLARVIIMGNLHLIRGEDGNYAVRDVYCSKDRSSSDFRKSPPAPGVVPDNRVVNVEHTWPQSRFNGRFSDDMQKADLHHLFPTDSKINAIRGNNIFGEVSHDLIDLRCTESRFGLGTAGAEEVFEPPQDHKGNVARALFYFSIRYDLPIDDREEVVLRKWHREDPVDAEEMRRNEEIYRIQTNRNPFVDFAHLADKIADF